LGCKNEVEWEDAIRGIGPLINDIIYTFVIVYPHCSKKEICFLIFISLALFANFSAVCFIDNYFFMILLSSESTNKSLTFKKYGPYHVLYSIFVYSSKSFPFITLWAPFYFLVEDFLSCVLSLFMSVKDHTGDFTGMI